MNCDQKTFLMKSLEVLKMLLKVYVAGKSVLYVSVEWGGTMSCWVVELPGVWDLYTAMVLHHAK